MVNMGELTLSHGQLFTCIRTLYLYTNIVPVYEHLDDGAKVSPVYNAKKSQTPCHCFFKYAMTLSLLNIRILPYGST